MNQRPNANGFAPKKEATQMSTPSNTCELLSLVEEFALRIINILLTLQFSFRTEDSIVPVPQTNSMQQGGSTSNTNQATGSIVLQNPFQELVSLFECPVW
jgi:hypothetical protein